LILKQEGSQITWQKDHPHTHPDIYKQPCLQTLDIEHLYHKGTGDTDLPNIEQMDLHHNPPFKSKQLFKGWLQSEHILSYEPASANSPSILICTLSISPTRCSVTGIVIAPHKWITVETSRALANCSCAWLRLSKYCPNNIFQSNKTYPWLGIQHSLHMVTVHTGWIHN